VRTTLKRGIGRGASVNGNGRAILPPGPYTPVRRYRVEPPRHPGWRAAGRVATWIVGTIVLLAGLGQDDEQDQELRALATRVAALLKKRSDTR
jgi:hypothetical protein